jgi:hypothetical protein
VPSSPGPRWTRFLPGEDSTKLWELCLIPKLSSSSISRRLSLANVPLAARHQFPAANYKKMLSKLLNTCSSLWYYVGLCTDLLEAGPTWYIWPKEDGLEKNWFWVSSKLWNKWAIFWNSVCLTRSQVCVKVCLGGGYQCEHVYKACIHRGRHHQCSCFGMRLEKSSDEMSGRFNGWESPRYTNCICRLVGSRFRNLMWRFCEIVFRAGWGDIFVGYSVGDRVTDHQLPIRSRMSLAMAERVRQCRNWRPSLQLQKESRRGQHLSSWRSWGAQEGGWRL